VRGSNPKNGVTAGTNDTFKPNIYDSENHVCFMRMRENELRKIYLIFIIDFLKLILENERKCLGDGRLSP